VLAPDESVSSAFTVLTDGACPGSGTCTFENAITVSDGRERATPLRELALERNGDGAITSSSATLRA
jgi:hypothetical protein